MEPMVSIVVPTYNQAHLLKEALDSVLAQSFTNWEAIIVNNFSKDDTVKVVEGFEEPRFQLMNFKNKGVIAASRNQGILRTKGEYIAFLDSDDLWEPNKLERCLERIRCGFDLVCHGILVKWEDGREIYASFGPESRARYNALLYEGNCISTSATMVRKELLVDLNGFDENPDFITAEDYDLWMRIAQKSGQISFINEKLGVNRYHGNNASSSDLKYFNAEWAVLSSHFANEKKHNRLNPLKMRKRYALAYYNIGRKFQDLGKIKNALPYYFRSLKCYPFYKDLYISLSIALKTFFSGKD